MAGGRGGRQSQGEGLVGNRRGQEDEVAGSVSGAVGGQSGTKIGFWRPGRGFSSRRPHVVHMVPLNDQQLLLPRAWLALLLPARKMNAKD